MTRRTVLVLPMGGLLRDDTAYIQGLIDAAEPGATVVIPPGEYRMRGRLDLRGRNVDGRYEVTLLTGDGWLNLSMPGSLARIRVDW